jgi:hypothetical protein
VFYDPDLNCREFNDLARLDHAVASKINLAVWALIK